MSPSRAAVALLAVAALALAGCASARGVVPPQDAQGRYVVKLEQNLTFNPREARIPVGGTILWVNNGTAGHDVHGYVGDPPKEDLPEFYTADASGLTRLLGPGESYAHTFPKAGTWTIWCHTHHEERMMQIVHVG
jgi:plastocyanin